MDSGRLWPVLLALLLLGPIPAAGTSPAAAPAPAGIPIPVHAVRVVIANSQSVGTGTYQQMVVVNSSAYAAWLNANDSNVEWRYLNGTPIPAWMEANASSSATRTTWWLLLYSIPATSSVTVFLDMYGIGQMLLSRNGPTGEAPQLSAGYGALDDGWKVFGFYDNFSGTSLKSTWQNVGSPSFTVSNGLSTEAGGWQVGFLSNFQVALNSTIDVSFNSTGPGPYFNAGLGSNSTNQFVDYEFRYQDANKAYAFEGNPGIPGSTQVANAAVPNVWLVMSGDVSSSILLYLNYTYLVASGTGPSPYSSYVSNNHKLHIGACCNNAQTVLVRWLDVRTNPLSVIMPSVTLLPPIPIPSSPVVTRTNSSSIGISWTNPPNFVVDNSILVGNVTAGSCVGPYQTIDTAGPATSWNLTGLLPAHSYCIAVRDWFAGYVSSAFTAPPLVATTNSTAITLANPTAPGVAVGTLLLVGLAVGSLVALSLILWLGFPDHRSRRKGAQRPVDARPR